MLKKQDCQMNSKANKCNENSILFDSDVWADLVISILSVNNYTIDKSYLLYSNFRENGLFNPHNLSSWNNEKIINTLRKSGYERGDYMLGLFAERLLSLGAAADRLEKNIDVLVKGTKDQVVNLLSEVKGVGPVVIRNYMAIRGKQK